MLKRNNLISKIYDANIMAVARANPERTLQIAQACLEGGVKVIEVSFTVPTAIEAIRTIKKKLPEMIVCAGTVLDETTARLAILEGVSLVLSPSYSRKVAKICNLYQVPYAPGCNTISEMIDALKYGAAFIKVFPGSALNGPEGIKTIKAPVPDLPILVSGGATLSNYADFLEVGADCVSFGSALNGSQQKIIKNAKRLVEVLNGYRKN
ncbi:ketohydroxyglutarate aldolase [Ligilactobacillus acidipiscis]|uniref:ketohydroxyglutarate aldolase n=1 Tax=Ligilactobacillus acidipiscis TaxID=89059 RepID=UPI0022E3BE59|nr:ketohydroxyglutarate aldolase [Ligilactobacillus acidipiscis]